MHVLLSFSPFALGIATIYGLMLAVDILSLLRRPTIHGQVRTSESPRGVADVIITLSRHDGSVVAIAKSDSNGNYSFFVPQASYLLSATSDSYQLVTQEIGSVVEIQTTSIPKTGFQISMQKVPMPTDSFGEKSVDTSAAL